jgi:hypothetical protein
MAFNPFHAFRKHAKPIMAGLVLMCMFIFVLQFGAGDITSRMGRWFGGGAKGEVIATVYGEKLDIRDLGQLARQRRAATEFLNYANLEGFQAVTKDVPAVLDKVPALALLMRQHKMRLEQAMRGQPDFGGAFFELQQLDNLLISRAGLGPALSDADLTPEVSRAIASFRAALRFESSRFFRNSEFYFGGDSSVDSLLDFKIWLHQADLLGIYLSDDQLRKAVNREALDRDFMTSGFDARDGVAARFVNGAMLGDRSRYRDLTTADLREAVANEFRALMAQEAFLGELGGVRQVRHTHRSFFDMRAEPRVIFSPGMGTPDEFFRYFLEQRTEVAARLLTVSVDDFLKEVTQAASEDDLERLFRKYKDQEPSPDSPTPGFKEPLRVRAAWVSFNPDAPQYAERAKVLRILESPGLPMVSAGAIPFGGLGGFAPWAVSVATSLTFDPLAKEYETYRDSPWLSTREVPLHDPSIYRVETLALGFGQLAGAGLLAPTPTPPALFAPVATAAHFESRERDRNLAFDLMTGTQRLLPTLSLDLGTASAVTAAARYPAPALPRSQVQGRFEEQFLKTTAKRILNEDRDALTEELWKASTTPGAKPDAAIKEKLTKLGLKLEGEMAKPLTRFELADDATLKPFKEAFVKGETESKSPQAFANLFFGESPARGRAPALYQPITWPRIPQPDKPEYLAWQVERVSPREPNSLNEAGVRAKVVDAWKKQKARELARKKAREYLAKYNEGPAPAAGAAAGDKLQQLSPSATFELTRVARLLPASENSRSSVSSSYKPYEAPKDVMPYPAPNLVDRLQRLAKVGDAVVISDKPEDHFYVAVLTARSPDVNDEAGRKDLYREFEQVYRRTALGEENPDPLWRDYFMRDMEQRYKDRVMWQLRMDAVGPDKVDADGKIKLPDNAPARIDDRGRGVGGGDFPID